MAAIGRFPDLRHSGLDTESILPAPRDEPRIKRGVPKVGGGSRVRRLQLCRPRTREDRNVFAAPSDAGGRDQEIRLKCVVSNF